MRNAQFVGRLVRDPRKTEGRNSAPIAIAVNESYKDKEGEWQNKTYFITSWAYNKTADYAANNLKKGDILSVESRVTTKTNDQGHTEGYDFTVTNLKRIHKSETSVDRVTTEEVPF